MLEDFKMLFENGAFYLAKGRMKTPVFFEETKGKSAFFNQGCTFVADRLKKRCYKTGKECWSAVWSEVLKSGVLDGRRRLLIINMGDAFFEKSAKAMEVKLTECAAVMEKEIAAYTKAYRENKKVLCPVGMLGGLMLSIILM